MENKIKVVNPCIICGKERVIVKTFKEKVGNSVVISTITECPDKDCQKKVEEILEKEQMNRTRAQKEFKKQEIEKLKRIKKTHWDDDDVMQKRVQLYNKTKKKPAKKK